MCRRALLLLALCVLALPARAQGPAAAPGTARLDSLQVELNAAREAVQRETLSRRAALRARPAEPLDSGRVGPLLVVARPRELPRARRALGEAWRALAPLVGDAPLPELVMLVTYGTAPRAFAELRSRPHHYQAWPGLGDAAAPIRRALSDLLTPELRAWLGRGSLGESPGGGLYRELATSPASASRRCLAGDPAGCAAALGIGGEPVATADSSERPLRTAARASFLTHLVRAHGAHAFATLRQGQGEVGGQLGALGPLGPELLTWQAEMVAARPRAHDGLARSAAVATLWIAALFGLALRSTRWRLG